MRTTLTIEDDVAAMIRRINSTAEAEALQGLWLTNFCARAWWKAASEQENISTTPHRN
ncbi:hypothetical protein [Marispirochaeta sp.]|uniref:hypothetical protein n=1 Tax=Marispirochaeta sp. TaxID=2038653 RepID=UPI0029C67EC7|nr:hypothetical protein [Marispirochaeta sp.]